MGPPKTGLKKQFSHVFGPAGKKINRQSKSCHQIQNNPITQGTIPHLLKP